MVSRLNRERPLPSVQAPRTQDSVLQRMLEGLFVPLREVVRFLQPFVQPQPWALAELTSSWVMRTNAPTIERAGYRKDPMGRVHLRGQARQTGASNVVFQLPAELRPPKYVSFVTDSNLAAAVVGVYSDGRVEYQAGGTPATYLTLDGISFDTEE